MDVSPSRVTLVALNEKHVYRLVKNGDLATLWAVEQAAAAGGTDGWLEEMATG